MTELGIGLIGVGRHGQRYARHIMSDVAEFHLAAICRRDPRAGARDAERFGCRGYDGVEGLLADPGVDAVAVVVPPDLHARIVAAALKAGKAVLLEKPAALDVEAGRRMLEAEAAAGVPVMVAQTLRYNGVVCTLMNEREKLGAIHSIRISHRFEPSPVGWVDEPEMGGILFHTGVHSFDLVRVFSGKEVKTVRCVTRRIGGARTANHFSAILELDDGAGLATVSGCRGTASRTGALEIAGEHGQLVGDHVHNTASLVQGKSVRTLPTGPDTPTVLETLRDFARVIADRAEVPISLKDGLRAAAVAGACRDSAASGKPVAVPSIE